MSISRLAREVNRGMRALERALATDQTAPTFTWGNVEYPCVPSQTVASQSLGPGGFSLEADLTLYVRVEVLPTPGPQENQFVTVKGKRYRIDKLSTLPGDSILRLICNDPSLA